MEKEKSGEVRERKVTGSGQCRKRRLLAPYLYPRHHTPWPTLAAPPPLHLPDYPNRYTESILRAGTTIAYVSSFEMHAGI
ncbi:hypothetical protein BHE74_00041409 [Ensete ventricosum]|nr:hypothetical protein GW17_00007152 [Ensete ventricosum]RWW52187.1 hypothetical protein BHE74_00041409 [Ensete ventricosum]